MKLQTTFLTMLLLMAATSAWWYAPPSCLQTYSVLGNNYTHFTLNQSLCATWKQLLRPYSGGDSKTNVDVNQNTTINFATSGAFNTSQTFSVTTTDHCVTQGGDSPYIQSNCSLYITGTDFYKSNDTYKDAPGDGGTVTSTCTLALNISYNGVNTTYSNDTYSATVAGPPNIIKSGWTSSQVSSFTSSISTITGSNYFANITNAFRSVDDVYSAGLSNYLAIGTNKEVISDFATGGRIVPSGSTYCQAVLIYSGSMLITPKITYFPGIDALPDFASGSKAYLLNNSDAYVLDSNTGFWFYVPTVTCTNASLGGQSVAYYSPGGGGTYNLPNYNFNGVQIGLTNNGGFCANSSTDAYKKITAFVTGSTTDTYTIRVYDNNSTEMDVLDSTGAHTCAGCLVSGHGCTCTGAGMTLTFYPQANATNVTVIPTRTAGASMTIANTCSFEASTPPRNNRAVFAVLFILTLLAAAFMEQRAQLGVETFALLVFICSFVADGFIIPMILMVFYFGMRIIKPFLD